ncbi:nicotinate-nucleotide adenylyltransferase [cf. Phormidesmis sp. LEGE 11477]|uniref:nicotinate-nucleotide adenylyltransferase n=1 Tax=cf. Phormidesmis sp. LEGE 11477 TaxID=1828680 RepID=UPI00187E3F2F|nr:nicotinate-nucleotide adenylyltransferase [cf. Phormidesmis sp. LEGE 11477]MBE9061531.1 nicotinate-nucleotide adenylyltransferase [cf. Phormidesmis sp. LEGE 11477]
MRFLSKSPRIALFGTSADPPHLGHQSILLWLSAHFDQTVVWAADNPYKEEQSPIGDRAQMLRLLTDTLSVSETINNISVSQQLSDRYSINSIARARRIWPKANFSFVIGADLLDQLPKWYQAKEIFKQVNILVFPRPGYPIKASSLLALRQLADVDIAQPTAQYDVSSSTYRQTRCDHSEQTAHFFDDLPAVIRDYITEHDLYPCLQQTTKAKISTGR